jgi:hypothetical protein
MAGFRKILRYSILFLILILFSGTGAGCAAKKNPWSNKKSKNSHVSATQLGRNKYYFSVGYQKKLQKSVKKKK